MKICIEIWIINLVVCIIAEVETLLAEVQVQVAQDLAEEIQVAHLDILQVQVEVVVAVEIMRVEAAAAVIMKAIQ